MNAKRFAALLGFLFVGAWIAFGFGDAILCLIGGAVFYLATGLYLGELDVAELQRRASQTRGRANR